MKISVVITTYNLADYIEECVQSILEQSCRPDEVIVADDSSSDDTIRLATTRWPDLVLVRQEVNRGALLNTLSGLNRATGDIVAFIDGDDTWPKNKLERVRSQFLLNPDTFLVTHRHRRVDAYRVPTGVIDETHRNISRIMKIPDDGIRQMEFRKSVLMRKGFWLGSAYSLRRSAIDLGRLNALVMDDPCSRYAYLDLVLGPYATQTNPKGRIVYLEDVVFDYRLHSHSSAASGTLEKQQLAILRGRCTNLVTQKVLRETCADSSTINEYKPILREYDFLESLYSKRYFASFGYFFCLLTFFVRKGRLFKEFARLVLVSCIGPRRFLQMKRAVV